MKTRATTNPSISRSKDGVTKKRLEKINPVTVKTVKDDKPKKPIIETIEKADKRATIHRQPPSTTSINVKIVKKPKISTEKSNVTTEKPSKLKTASQKSLSIEKKPTNSKANVKMVSTTTTNRKAPMRATHSIDVKSTSVKPSNVMNQVHNVTVSSPPPFRRELNESQSMETEIVKSTVENLTTRDRTRTRTLGESEIILLKPMPNGAIEKKEEIFESEQCVNVEIRPSISFEVHFDEEKANEMKDAKIENKKLELNKNGTNDDSVNVNDNTNETNDDEQNVYEDDFESYESDFEIDLSSNEEPSVNVDSNTKSDEETTYDDDSSSRGGSSQSSNNSNIVKSATKHPFKIQNSASDEFDSGSFEMKPLQTKGQDDYNYAVTTTEHQKEIQNDSGFDNNSQTLNPSVVTLNSLEINNKTCDNISDIEIEMNASTNNNTNNTNAMKTEKLSKLTLRGNELLEKIVLDTMNFSLYESKPISYDLYMKIYGNNKSSQIAVQTHYDHIDIKCQCDDIQMTTSWTQMPPTFYQNEMKLKNFPNYKIGSETTQYYDQCDSNLNNSWQLLQQFMKPKEHKQLNDCNYIDFDALNRFLLIKEITMTELLIGKNTEWKNGCITISDKYLEISIDSIQSLKTLKFYKLFATNSLPGFIFSIHYDSNRLMHLIVMWNLSDTKRPFCMLSSWTKIICIEIHENIKNVVFGGLSDG